MVHLNPTIGSEIQKTRPCVIFSPNEMNQYLNTIIIAPMTSSLKKHPTRILVNYGGKNWMIGIDETQTIDKITILKTFEKLTKTEITNCKNILKETFVD